MAPPLTQTMYLRYSSKDLAKQSNADFWTRILGHPKRPEDVTEFLFQTLGCKDGAHDYIVLTEPWFSTIWPLLTQTEQNFVTTNMVDVNNVQVQSCLNSIKPPAGP